MVDEDVATTNFAEPDTASSAIEETWVVPRQRPDRSHQSHKKSRMCFGCALWILQSLSSSVFGPGDARYYGLRLHVFWQYQHYNRGDRAKTAAK